MRRTGLIVAALVALVAGTYVLAQPGIVSDFTADTLVIYLVGAGMILLGFVRTVRGRHRRRQAVDLGDPESLVEYPTPGDSLDRAWDDFRFRTVAKQVIQRSRGCSEEEAATLLETGQWTDDPVASAYFRSQAPLPEARDPERARKLIAAASRERRRRALEALADMVRFDRPGEEG